MTDSNIDLLKINKIFFCGIGGIGISAAARLLRSQGKNVLGSDAAANEITASLEKEGLKILIPQQTENILPDLDLLVYSVAVPEDNPERMRAKYLKIPEITYPQLLGLAMKNKYGIGVSGTDGKTTTTAMLAKIMIEGGLDPTVILGSRVDFLQDNFRLGQSDYFVFEADEYRRAFDNYFPRLAVLTNIGLDHLDYYKDEADYVQAFKDYLNGLPSEGMAIINTDDKKSVEVSEVIRADKMTYAIDGVADLKVQSIRLCPGSQTFEVIEYGKLATTITLTIPGRYNVYNSLAAIAAARILKIDWPIIQNALGEFAGTWRRFERLGRLEETEVIADYAHTPDAVSKTIVATKEFYPDKKVLTVFQPHQYARTKNLFNDFVRALTLADQVIVADVFYVRGRENPEDFDVSAEKLTKAARKAGAEAIYGGDLAESERLIRGMAADFDIILVMGAGDIYEVAKKLVI
ncbi:MAG: UDP-N-acetylmuramate--L-alanine ligase [Patescibacteria group bacterium]